MNTVLSLVSGCAVRRTTICSTTSSTGNGSTTSTATSSATGTYSSSRGISYTVHDGQLMAWRIPPAQYRSLRAAADALNTAPALQGISSSSDCTENIDHTALFADLITVLTSLS